MTIDSGANVKTPRTPATALALIMLSTLAVSSTLTWHASAQPRDAGRPRGKNDDLVELGETLLDKPVPKPRVVPVPATRPTAIALIVDAAVPAVLDAAIEAGVVDAGAEEAGVDAAAPEVAVVVDAGPEIAAVVDAGAPVAAAAETKPTPKAPSGAVGKQARKERVASGENLDMKAAEESPLAKMGVPVQAVPVVATVATAGAMAFWPFVLKTLTAMIKSVAAGLLKNRAKKGEKIDAAERTVSFMGLVFRPRELIALLIAGIVYGLAVTYAFQGRKIDSAFLLRQEFLVLMIYFTRSAVRFFYQRAFKIATRYKFWAGGAFLCLGSAYLGNTLGTVGYELEASSGPGEAERILKMKTWLIVITLALAFGFCIANVYNPSKFWQAGRVMLAGMALAEVLPISPMPGLKILRWRGQVWAPLFVVVTLSFYAINFIL